ncbi:hypothetical protein ACQEVZ_39800 [Dactylosporangium sp. CA-152071]|uniref:hypothetical protein n=1 Tax=Dactylosporangium sp. CA-152071 TaxID=3239933 RepID=UPI003D8F6930
MTDHPNGPADTYVGIYGGGTTWDIPGSYNWNMTAGQSTTTLVARRRPDQKTECFARFRHQPNGVVLLSMTGAC